MRFHVDDDHEDDDLGDGMVEPDQAEDDNAS